MKCFSYNKLCAVLLCLFAIGGCTVNPINAVRLNRRAQVYFRHGHYDDAQKLLADSLDADFENSASHYWMGRCFQVKANLPKAIYEYQLAVRFDPAMELSQMALIRTLYLNNQPEESLEAAQVFLNHKVSPASDFLRLARSFSSAQMNQHTVLAYARARQIAPNSAEPSIAWADFYFAQGNQDNGLEKLIEAFMIDPHYPGLARRLGQHNQRVEIPDPVLFPIRSDLQKELDSLEN